MVNPRRVSPEMLDRWIKAVGRAGILRKARPGFFARLFGFEVAPAGDFSEATLTRLKGGAR